MKARPTLLLALAVLFTGLIPAIHAQTENEAASLRLFSWHGDFEQLVVKAGRHATSTALDEFTLGPEIPLPAGVSTLSLHRSADDDEAPPLAVVDLPPAASHLILLLAPAAPGGEHPYVAQVIDDSPRAQPDETLRLFNFSTRTVAITAGKEVSVIAPGDEWLASYAASAAPHTLVQLALQTGDGWKIIRRGLQPTPSDRRVICFVRDGRIDRDNLDPNARARAVDSFFIVREKRPAPL